MRTSSFIRGGNPLDSIGIGQRAIIKEWLEKMGIQNYSINEDYSIDVKYSVDISGRGLEKLPDFIKFGIVGLSFYCHNNNLT